MNNDGDSNLDEDELEIQPTMELLKRLEPTLASRIKNRRIVATGLATHERRFLSSSVPWWRRSISIPLPVALAVVLLLASAFLWLPMLRDRPGGFAVSSNSAEPFSGTAAVATPAKSSRANAERTLGYSATETYLCGIGRIKDESIYEVKE
jgi:hypothetical protein